MLYEETRELEKHHLRYKNMLQDFTFVINQDLYKIIYENKNAGDSDLEGEGIFADEKGDILDWLKGKQKITAQDILGDEEGWE